MMNVFPFYARSFFVERSLFISKFKAKSGKKNISPLFTDEFGEAIIFSLLDMSGLACSLTLFLPFFLFEGGVGRGRNCKELLHLHTLYFYTRFHLTNRIKKKKIVPLQSDINFCLCAQN